MALQIRPNCEYCDLDLPPDSSIAMICSYECTFCADCVETRLHNVCPNCGGGFEARPIRPARAWRAGVSLVQHPASVARVLTRHSEAEMEALSAQLRTIPPALR